MSECDFYDLFKVFQVHTGTERWWSFTPLHVLVIAPRVTELISSKPNGFIIDLDWIYFIFPPSELLFFLLFQFLNLDDDMPK